MQKSIYICSLVFILSACNSIKNANYGSICKRNVEIVSQLQVLSIDSCKDVFNLKCVDFNNLDTLNVISFKENIYSVPDTSNLSNIQIGEKYSFELKKMRIRVSTMQQLGQFIIADNDTLWRGKSEIIPPAYYICKNSLRLECWSCFNNQ